MNYTGKTLALLGAICMMGAACQSSGNRESRDIDTIEADTTTVDTSREKPVEELLQQDTMDVNNRELRTP